MVTVPTILLEGYEGLPLPRYQTDGAVALDLYATKAGFLIARRPTLVGFGLAVAIPPGYEGQIRGRSGLAKCEVYCHAGTIDQDYRGELMALLTFAPETVGMDGIMGAFAYDRGDRMAQLVISPVVRVCLDVVLQLPETGRGDGGFGSTGR